MGFGIVQSVAPTGIAVAGCFQRGGYNPPPCTTTAPTATSSPTADQDATSSTSTSSATSPDTSQDGTGSPDKDQSESSPGGSSPADSGISACQNQNAMPIAIGLPTNTCRASQGPNKIRHQAFYRPEQYFQLRELQ